MLDIDQAKDAILLAALPHVVFDGWTQAVIERGAQDAGYDSFAAIRAFPGGPAELVEHFADWADRQMLDALSVHDLAAMRTRDRVALAVRTRLELLAPHQEAVRRSLSFLALPQNAPQAARQVYNTVDRIWLAAGDTATDFNFYTKRGLLAGVVGATTLYWLNDSSDGHADSWDFLDRRIDDVMRIGRTVGRVLAFDASLLRWFPSPNRFMRALRRDDR